MNGQIDINVADKAIKEINEIRDLVDQIVIPCKKLEDKGFKITIDAKGFKL